MEEGSLLGDDVTIITGPTASGKGTVAFSLAGRIDGEIVSLDSMKVYREMDIGTAKASIEKRRAIPHHLMDIVDPNEAFSTGDFLSRCARVFAEIRSRGKKIVVSGGTALYLMGLVKGLSELPAADWALRERLRDEAERDGVDALHERLRSVDAAAADRILPGDLRRIVRALEVYEVTGRPMSESWEWGSDESTAESFRLHGIAWERQEIYRRTDRRVERMVERGLFDEVRRLAAREPAAAHSALQCIGYKEVIEGWEQGWSDQQIIETVQRNTRRLVKRQLTWFRKLPIEWIEASGELDVDRCVETILGTEVR
ncbi:MAG: tRNA (adenosine(37)-N6)-dimethylallyltransferase MiaA [Planctomycetota bacterium]